MGSGASTATGSAALSSLELGLDVPEHTVEDICGWIQAQGAVSELVGAELCDRMTKSGLSAAQLLLHMDQDELLTTLDLSYSNDDAKRKQALGLVQAGRQALRRDFHVLLKDLPDAMDKAVYVLERFPLVVDPSGQALRFLKYQRGGMLMAGNPADMTPKNLRKHLVGALKLGSLLIINFDMLNTLELEQFFDAKHFPRQVLSRSALFAPEVVGALLRPEEGDPDVNDFVVNDQFKLVLVFRSEQPSPKTALAMCVLHVHVPGDGSNQQDSEDPLMKALGVQKEVRRNSLDLVEAAFDNDRDAVIRWLDKNYDIESEDGHAHTALSEAACQGHTDLVLFLLERGANPNKANDEGRSPLYRAAYNGHLETIRALLEGGADPRVATKQNELPFDVAKTPEVRELLAQWDLTKTDNLLEARRKVIEAKLQERIATYVEREQHALMQVHQELLELARTGDAETLDSRLTQLVDDAIENNEKLRATADVRDERGNTLLALAVQRDRFEVVELLLTKWKQYLDADHQGGSNSDETRKRNAMMVRAFKASVNARDCRGWTPAAIAVFHESKRCLRLLLEHGADPSLRNQYNKNAFDLAKDDLDAANCVVKSREEIRGVLIEWENARRVVAPPVAAPVEADKAEADSSKKKSGSTKKDNKASASSPSKKTAGKSTDKSDAPAAKTMKKTASAKK